MKKIAVLALPLCGLVSCENKKTEDIYGDALKSAFTVRFVDVNTEETKASCTGFFITEDGLGVTSGPLIRLYQGCKVLVKLPDLQEYIGKVVYNPLTPGVGYVQITGPGTTKLRISQKECVEGQDLFALGVHDQHPYFSDVYVTDTSHPWIQISENDLYNTPVIRTTGLLPNECVGGPLIDHQGNTVALIFNIEMGLGIAYSLHNLTKVYQSHSDWAIIKAYKNFRKAIIDKFLKE